MGLAVRQTELYLKIICLSSLWAFKLPNYPPIILDKRRLISEKYSINFLKHILDTYTVKLIAMSDCKKKQNNGQTKRKFSSEIFYVMADISQKLIWVFARFRCPLSPIGGAICLKGWPWVKVPFLVTRWDYLVLFVNGDIDHLVRHIVNHFGDISKTESSPNIILTNCGWCIQEMLLYNVQCTWLPITKYQCYNWMRFTYAAKMIYNMPN
jgi:hypothetical protein